MKKAKKRKYKERFRPSGKNAEEVFSYIYESQMKELNESFDAAVKAIPQVFKKHSVLDIATSLFVSSIWLPNISSLIKHQFLIAIFASLKPDEFLCLKTINSHSSFSSLMKEIFPLLPTFLMLEDFVPEIDWGEIKFHHNNKHYKIFYGNELSHVYDYLTLFQMLYLPFEKEYSQLVARSPQTELRYCLQLQDEVISGITSQPKPETLKALYPGHVDIPPYQFWKNASQFYNNFKPQNSYEKSFLENYSAELGTLPAEQLRCETFQDMVMKGKVLPKFFIKHEGRYMSVLPRRYSSILFDSWSQVYAENYSKVTRDGMPYSMHIGAELYRYIKARVRSSCLYPLVSAVTPEGPPHEIVFSTAFISKDRLILIYITSPWCFTQKIEDELNEISKKLQVALRLIEKPPVTLALHLERKNVQFLSKTEDKKLKPELIILVPPVSTNITYLRIPNPLPGMVITMDQFLGIIDELESADMLSSFLEYCEEYGDRIGSAMVGVLDLFGSFKSSHTVLIEGALEYDQISIDPHWGSNMRYETLSEFWSLYPEVHFFDHPRSWNVRKITETRTRLEARGYFGWALYSQLGSTHIFLNSPFNKMSYEQGRVSNLLMECLEDSISTNKTTIDKHKYFQSYEQLQVLFFPVSLISTKRSFKHLTHLKLNGELWCSDIGLIKSDIFGIRIVFDDKALVTALVEAQDRSLEIDLLVEVLTQLDDIIPDIRMSSIVSVLQKQKKTKPRFKMFKANKQASFPELVSPYEPDLKHFKKARRRIAELAKLHNLTEGHYAREEAKTRIDAVRKAIVSEIDSEVNKYDFKKAVPFLLTRTDALIDKHERLAITITRSLEHDADYARDKQYSKEETEYLRTHKNYRYLIEKFVQMCPQSPMSLGIEQFQYLLALIDWLHVLYTASDSLHYDISPSGMKVDNQFLIEVTYDSKYLEKQEEFGKEKANLKFGIDVNQEDEVSSPRSARDLLDAIDIAFKKDLRFRFTNMVNVLEVLTHWVDFRPNVSLSTFYSASATEIGETCKQIIKGFNEKEVIPILSFLTLRSEEVIRVIGREEICDDLPVWEHKKRSSRYNIKPLIMIEDKYYWGPHSTRKSAIIWSGNLSWGTLPAELQSRAIEKQLKSEKNLIEKALESKALEIVKRFTPHSVKNFQFHTRDRAGGHPPNLGDYDVLAFCSERSIVINIECKDILPPFCLKDAKRLRETIFGAEGKDWGHFRQIRKRQDYLSKNLLALAPILNWPIDPNNLPEIITIYLTRTTYWWTRFPPRNVNVVFLQVQQLSNFISALDRKA